MNWRIRSRKLREDESTSSWLRYALTTALGRDTESAIRDAEILEEILWNRWMEESGPELLKASTREIVPGIDLH